MPPSFLETLISLGGIIFIDLVLSGDNALVIGAAASVLPAQKRWLAFLFGAGGAICMRILFTTSATFLLGVPFLQAVGGILVLYIATRLILDEATGEHEESGEQQGAQQTRPSFSDRFSALLERLLGQKLSPQRLKMLLAIVTIVIADVSMSLDNVVAVGAIAKGHLFLLISGLVLSIALLMLGSAVTAELIKRFPALTSVASFILAWVSADLIWNDAKRLSFLANNELYHYLLYAVTFIIISFVLILHLKQKRSFWHKLGRGTHLILLF